MYISKSYFLLKKSQYIHDYMLFGGYNVLKLNEEKTEFIIFGVHPSQHNNVSLTIGRNDIKLSESIKILG